MIMIYIPSALERVDTNKFIIILYEYDYSPGTVQYIIQRYKTCFSVRCESHLLAAEQKNLDSTRQRRQDFQFRNSSDINLSKTNIKQHRSRNGLNY